MYIRKTRDEWIIQSYYDSTYGWEDTCAYDNRKDAREDLKAYRDNQPEYQHRIIKERVKI